MARPPPICNYCQNLSHTQQNCRKANGLCLACGSSDHSMKSCPHKRTWMMTWIFLALPAPSLPRNPGSVVRRAPLLPQQQVFCQVQKETRAASSHGKGQAYNLTAEEAETSKEVIAVKIMVHSKLILALFDFDAFHYFISDSFTALHSIPLICLDNLWDISTGNGVVISNRVCKNCTVESCNRKLVVDMLVLDTTGYNVILDMTWLSRYHAVIDCWNKKFIFKISYLPKFQFIGEPKSAKKKKQLEYANKVKKKGIPV